MGREMGGRFRREGIYVYLWLIHVEVWEKTTEFCKAIILQLKKKQHLPVFVVQSLSPVWLFATPWTAAHQISLSFIILSLLKLMSIDSVMLSNHLSSVIPFSSCLFLPSIRVFSNESVLHIRWPKYWNFSFSISYSWNKFLDCEEGWVPKNWCFWTVVLEKTLESPLDCKEIQPVQS